MRIASLPLLLLLLLRGAQAAPAVAADYVALPGGCFASVLPADGKQAPAQVAPFRLRSEPVTNAEFLAFVTTHPEWRRDRVPPLFADNRYLSHWAAADTLGDAALPQQPVTRVSWFAAQAYCESEDARLPTWYEWESAAAADATRADARDDAAWRERVLDWYSRPSNQPLPAVGGAADLHGVRDLNGLVWEWVGDFNALLLGGESRDPGGADKLKFCGPGALNMQQKENYATLMRVAMLSALKAVDTTNNLGFRCAKSAADAAATPAAAPPLPGDSIYQLDVQLTNQDGKVETLAARRGRVQLVSLFYTSCAMVCPLIIDTLRATRAAIDEPARQQLDVLAVSFDPTRDDVAALHRYAEARKLDLSHWTLARTDPTELRQLAAVLGLQFRQMPDGEFNHSSELILLDTNGRIVARTAVLGRPDPAFVDAVRATLAAN